MEKKIKILGSTISYLDNNRENKPTLLCFHGNSSSKKSFKFLYDSELNQNYRIVSFDLFGHGQSEVGDNDLYSMRGFIQLTHDLVHMLNLDNITLLGHSLGGHIAIESIPLINSRVQGLITWATPPLSGAQDFASAFSGHPAQAALFAKDVDPKLSQDLINAFTLSNFTGDASSLAHDFDTTDPNFRAALMDSMGRGEVGNEIEILNNFNKPYLIIQGNYDLFISTDYMVELKKQHDLNIQFEDFSHYPQVDATEDLLSSFSSLLQSIVTNYTLTRANGLLENEYES